MIERSIQRLEYLCNTVPVLLAKIPDAEFSFKPHPQKWSKKEILGHLVDSASNNHQRFIRTQFEDNPSIFYDQDQWNKHSKYSNFDSSELILFWVTYNNYLTEIIKNIPEENLSKTCRVGEEKTLTLELVIEDYVRHMEHHLKQLVSYF